MNENSGCQDNQQTLTERRDLVMTEEEGKLPWYKKPKPEGVQIGDIMGGRPKLYNLKDHPEFNGRKLTVVKVATGEGQYGPFLILGGYIDSEVVTLITGADDIKERLLPVMDAINADGAVIEGTLHLIGRKWLFD